MTFFKRHTVTYLNERISHSYKCLDKFLYKISFRCHLNEVYTMSTKHDDWWNQHICVCVCLNPSYLGAEILIQSTFLCKCCWDPNLCKEIPLIWVFPKIGVPPNHPFFIGFSIINHPFWGTPIFGNSHMMSDLWIILAPVWRFMQIQHDLFYDIFYFISCDGWRSIVWFDQAGQRVAKDWHLSKNSMFPSWLENHRRWPSLKLT